MMRRLVAALFVLSAARTHLPGQKQAVHAYKVQGNVWMIVGAGANIAMQASKEGIFLVDTGAVGTSDAVLAAVREVTDAPIRYIVKTSISVDHVGGNAVLANLAGGATSGKGRGPLPNLIAHDNVLQRMSTPGPEGKSPMRTALRKNIIALFVSAAA